MKENPLRRLHALGQSIWLDYIRRDLISSGELRRLITEDGLRGITSNPATVCARYHTSPGSRSPERVLIGTPAAGVNPMLVSMQRPSRTAARLAVFAGGIGENAPVIRSRICADLGFLGIHLDQTRNASGEPVISADASRVAIRVIRTDEEVMIAKAVGRILDATSTTPRSP